MSSGRVRYQCRVLMLLNDGLYALHQPASERGGASDVDCIQTLNRHPALTQRLE